MTSSGAVAAIQHLPSPIPPDSPFLRALGTTAALKAPPQTDTLAQRALEEWERTLCENKAWQSSPRCKAGRPTIIHKDGGEMHHHKGKGEVPSLPIHAKLALKE